MGPKVGAVGVHVGGVGGGGLGLAPRYPLPVHVLPAVSVHRHEVRHHGVYGAGVQARDGDAFNREHSPGEGKKMK